MLNNIHHFLPSRKLGIPFVGLVLTFGLVGNQTQPVLSSQVEKVSTLLVTDSQVPSGRVQNNSETSLLSRLREVKGQKSQLKSELTSSASLLKNEKIAPKTVGLVPGGQASVKEANVISKKSFPTKDGTYLYGQSSKPDQIGQGYIIFQKQESRVLGAMYMPHSEFSCFQGTLDRSGELAMTVKGSADESSSNEVATASRIPKYADDEYSTYAYSVTLQDYHQLNSISANDRRILQLCNQSATGSHSKFVK